MGEFGVKRVEVNAHGVHLRELSVENSIPGDNLALSIDISLQQYISNLLSQHVGSVVVMDIENGEILAMNSSPSFNPNNIVEGISTKDWNKLLTDPNTPMLNKCISNHYPPGSIFKLITALASLKEGNSPSAIYNCKGYVVVGDRKFHCWKEHGHGDVNLTEAISQSCNCYFYNLAKKIGIDNIAHMAEIFGFGKKTHIELPNEINGLIPDRKWKISRFNKSWQIGDTINCAIGQGFVLTTPIQLAIMVSRIASGKKILPTILLDGNKDKEFEALEVSDTDLDAIRLGMFKAVNDYMGTSFRHRLDDEHFQMAGKTGTSQVVSKKGEKDDLSKKSTAWLHRNHGLFVSYAPFDKPKYAISVVIEHGGSGSGDAAPVARSIFTEIHNKLSTRQEIS
jgi:penicillin-binding protein 2